jgi:hypothetical protein
MNNLTGGHCGDVGRAVRKSFNLGGSCGTPDAQRPDVWAPKRLIEWQYVADRLTRRLGSG